MAKDTLLDMVQGILSDADGDEVNSIGDTVESEQCARIIQDEFYNIVDNMDLEHYKTVTQLTATGASTPTTMVRPEGFYDIEWIKYDNRLLAPDPPAFKTVYYMVPEDFMLMMIALRSDDTNVGTQLVNGLTINHYNDRFPKYYTFLDGYDNIIFDAYYSTLDTNLQASKSMAYGRQRPVLTIADATVPDLPQHQMTLLRNRARATYFDLFKDGVTSEVDRKRRNSEVRSQRQRHIAARNRRKDQRRTPDYGRK